MRNHEKTEQHSMQYVNQHFPIDDGLGGSPNLAISERVLGDNGCVKSIHLSFVSFFLSPKESNRC